MSIGFRIFLLILFAFGAVYAYRFREPQLYQWLRAQPAATVDTERDGLISPVDRVLEADVSLARLIGQPIPRPTRTRSKARDLHAEAASAGSFAEGLPPEEQLSAADLADPGQDSWGDTQEAAEDVPEDPAGTASGQPAGAERPEESVEPGPGVGAREEDVAYTEVTYKVEPGDNLWKIATKNLGSGARFGEIREMNPEVFRGKSTDALAVGAVLKIRIQVPEDSFKVPRVDADTTVERNSVPGPVEPRRKSSRPSVNPMETTKKIADR